MSGSAKVKGRKQHFELSPANRHRLEVYMEWYNSDPSRVTPKWKTGDIVNKALDRWLSRHFDAPTQPEDTNNAKENSQG